MGNIETLRYWCHKVLPLVYDDSLSYYEVLCKVSAKLNEVIDATNELGEHLNEQLLEIRELIRTEIARIETEFNQKLADTKTAIKDELTTPNSFNGNAIVDGSIADNKLISKFWHFLNRVPVRSYADLDDILNADNTENIVRLTVSGLGELNGVISAGDYVCVTNTNNTAMVLLNTETGVSWTYEKGSNNIKAVVNIPDGSIIGGVGGKIAAHTITDGNIASGTLTSRVFGDNSVGDNALINTYVKYLTINGYSTYNIDEALQVGGDKALYYMWTDPTGDLTPNEQISMWGYATNTAHLGEEDSYDVVFTDYTSRTWKYSQSSGAFTETNNKVNILFSNTDIAKYVKPYQKDCLVYAEIPIGIIPIGFYICSRNENIITLRCIDDSLGKTYTYNVDTDEITNISKFVDVGNITSISNLTTYKNTNTIYLFKGYGAFAGTVGDGVSRWVPVGTTASLFASNGKTYIYNFSSDEYSEYSPPMNLKLYAPTYAFTTNLDSVSSLASYLNMWTYHTEVETATVYLVTSGNLSGELWSNNGTIFDVKITKMLRTTVEGNSYWRIENLRNGEVKFAVLTSSSTVNIID